MYQEIDDPEHEVELKSERKRSLWLSLCLLLVAVLVMGVVLYVLSTPTSSQSGPSALEIEEAHYQTTQTEPSSALRRARLRDFIDTYPSSSHKTEVKAQLAVLDTAESKSWSDITEVVYNTTTTAEDKRTAIEVYETAWGPAYLGDREVDLLAFKETLPSDTNAVETPKTETDTETLDFTPQETGFPTTLSDTVMAGGEDGRFREIIQTQAPISQPYRRVTLSVIPPKIRKSVTPRYPSSAQRKGVNAVITVSLDIGTDGKVEEARVIGTQASRYERDFEKAALRAAKKTKFFPQTVNGVPETARGVVKRYRFEID